MKKFHLAIFLFLVVVISLVLADYSVYKAEYYRFEKQNKEYFNGFYKTPRYLSFLSQPYSPHTRQYLDRNSSDSRVVFGSNYKKPSIIVFGCSYAYGFSLEDNQTFSYKLSKLTQRPVYTKAVLSGNLSQMLYLLQKPDFFENINDVGYVIYIFIPDHIARLNTSIFPSPIQVNGCAPIYKLENKELKLKKALPAFLYKSFLVKKIIYLAEYNKIKNVYNVINKNNSYPLMNKVFIESKNIVEKHYPNAKFIILHYDTNQDAYSAVDTHTLLKKLENENDGIIVINTKDIVGKEFDKSYTVEDGYHPNETAWNMVASALVKKLKLYVN